MKTYLSVGCSCSFNITYGFELMLNPESSKNLFRILQCRDLNHFKLQAILFDNACNFNAYLLNREPRMYEYLRCLIDISHFHGHKKRKLNSNTRMGHLGCSSSFNAANCTGIFESEMCDMCAPEEFQSECDTRIFKVIQACR